MNIKNISPYILVPVIGLLIASFISCERSQLVMPQIESSTGEILVGASTLSQDDSAQRPLR